MALSKWKITCVICSKSESFGDTKDISYAKWRIIAWDVQFCEPKCVCDKCEYSSNIVTENNKKK